MGESVLPNGHQAPHGVAHEEALEAGVLLLYTRHRIYKYFSSNGRVYAA